MAQFINIGANLVLLGTDTPEVRGKGLVKSINHILGFESHSDLYFLVVVA